MSCLAAACGVRLTRMVLRLPGRAYATLKNVMFVSVGKIAYRLNSLLML